MKKWLSVVAVVVLCLSLVVGIACGGGGEGGAPGVKVVKLGWGEAMTGIYGAIVGIPAKKGVELAVDKIGVFTVGGEQYRWNVIFEDNLYTSAGGVATATKFIYQDGVKFMHQGSADAAMAVQDLCEGSGVLLDMSGAGLVPFGTDYPHSIQTAAIYLEHTPAFFKWLSENHPEIKRIAMLDSDDAMGHARMECQVTSAKHFGFDVVLQEFIPASTTEVYPVATKIMATHPDFFVGAWTVLKAMQEMGFKGLSAYNLWFSTTGTDVGVGKFQGHLCYLPLSWGEGVPPALAEFATEYQARYGEPCELCSWYAALVVYTLTSIVQQAGTIDDMDKILATIDTGTFDTVLLGEMRFFGEEICGLNRILLWPIQIHEWSGDQPRVAFTMDPEDAYELVLEVKGQPGYTK